MLNLVMFGPPGAGKGTQSARIAQKYQLKHVSTGEILREEVRRGSTMGLMSREYMDNGMLVQDEVLVEMLRVVIDENRYVNGFVFDGYPRTLVQAEELDRMLSEQGLTISLVLSLEVNEEELVTRLVKRAADQGRTDDKPDVIRKRLETYHLQTQPLLGYFSAQGKLVTVMGIGSVDNIFQSLSQEVDRAIP